MIVYISCLLFSVLCTHRTVNNSDTVRSEGDVLRHPIACKPILLILKGMSSTSQGRAVRDIINYRSRIEHDIASIPSLYMTVLIINAYAKLPSNVARYSNG